MSRRVSKTVMVRVVMRVGFRVRGRVEEGGRGRGVLRVLVRANEGAVGVGQMLGHGVRHVTYRPRRHRMRHGTHAGSHRSRERTAHTSHTTA